MKIFNKVITILLAVAFVALMCIYMDANIEHYTAIMDSDIASDTLLAEVIYENGFVQPKTWYASSEVCVISAPNFAAFIYPLVGKNMNLAMGITCNIMAIVMIVLMILYFRQIKFSWAMSIVPAVLIFSLMRANGEPQRMIILYAAYYVSHLITLFIIMMLYNRALVKGKVSVPVWICTVILAVLNGLQGLHACLFCYLPLLGVEITRRFILFIKKKKQENWGVSLWLLVVTAIAYIGTNLTGSYNSTPSRNIRHAGEKFVNVVVPEIKKVISDERLYWLAIIFLALAIVGYVLLIVDLVKSAGEESSEKLMKWGTISVIYSFIICVLSTTFTTFDAVSRYYLMLLYIVGFGVAIFVEEIGRRLQENRQKMALICEMVITAAVILYASVATVDFHTQLIENDDHESSYSYLAYKWMEEHGYDYGYTIFDNANCITVEANNAVKVRAVNNMKDMEGCKWLTDTTWYPPTKSTEGATCYLVSAVTEDEFNEFLKINNPEIIEIGEAGKYTIYVFDHDYTVWVD